MGYSCSKDQPKGDHSSIPGAASGTEEARVFSSGYTDHGLHIVGRGVKKLIKGIQSLRKLGVEGLVDPLPKIAVVGDQSTGKSSLIEGIRYIIHNQGPLYRVLKFDGSGIKVPRKAGCCTRVCQDMNFWYSILITSHGSAL